MGKDERHKESTLPFIPHPMHILGILSQSCLCLAGSLDLTALKTQAQGAFLHSTGTARAQRAHSTNYYGDYPGNNPENHAPAESCTINSKLENSNI